MNSPARDVLPTGVRRRGCLRDGMLPAVLLGELLAGMALGAAWPRLTAPPGAQSQLAPSTAVRAPAAFPVTVSAVLPAVASVPVVAPAPAHTPAAVPTVRNPFTAPTR